MMPGGREGWQIKGDRSNCNWTCPLFVPELSSFPIRSFPHISANHPARSQTPFGNALPETPFRVRFPLMPQTFYPIHNDDSHHLMFNTIIDCCAR